MLLNTERSPPSLSAAFFCRFSSGLELANLVVSSDLLHTSWDAISRLHGKTHSDRPNLLLSVKHQIHTHPLHGTVVAFISSPTCKLRHLQGEGAASVSSVDLRLSFPLFEFISTKVNPSFSIHKAALSLFESMHNELSSLKEQCLEFSRLIITGHSLGGSIASLFTLWILDSLDLKNSKRPLCITFGSPLIGDDGLQRAISERPHWNSCFLHVVSNRDPIPRFLAAASVVQPNFQFKPFGTFLVFSQGSTGFSCFDEPETVLEVISCSAERQDLEDDGSEFHAYGRVLEDVKSKPFYSGIRMDGELGRNSLQQGLALELSEVEAIPRQVNNYRTACFINRVEERMHNSLIRRSNVFDPTKKLNDMKISMTYLEWYKKMTLEQGGYYDSYKNSRSRSRSEIIKHHRLLRGYWKAMVVQVKGIPQKEGASFRPRWLYSGTNCRRILEPLDIADYYKKGKRDYVNQGRSEHYALLEKWFNDENPLEKQKRKAKERSKACNLTEDSCFWAHVEEAVLDCRVLGDAASSPGDRDWSRKNLIKFEQYVMELIWDFSASSEIFLEKSSFMRWWRQYERIMGSNLRSDLASFMKGQYRNYV